MRSTNKRLIHLANIQSKCKPWQEYTWNKSGFNGEIMDKTVNIKDIFFLFAFWGLLS